MGLWQPVAECCSPRKMLFVCSSFSTNSMFFKEQIGLWCGVGQTCKNQTLLPWIFFKKHRERCCWRSCYHESIMVSLLSLPEVFKMKSGKVWGSTWQLCRVLTLGVRLSAALRANGCPLKAGDGSGIGQPWRGQVRAECGQAAGWEAGGQAQRQLGWGHWSMSHSLLSLQQLGAEVHQPGIGSYLLESWLRAHSRLPLLFQNRPFMWPFQSLFLLTGQTSSKCQHTEEVEKLVYRREKRGRRRKTKPKLFHNVCIPMS